MNADTSTTHRRQIRALSARTSTCHLYIMCVVLMDIVSLLSGVICYVHQLLCSCLVSCPHPCRWVGENINFYAMRMESVWTVQFYSLLNSTCNKFVTIYTLQLIEVFIQLGMHVHDEVWLHVLMMLMVYLII
jgi:hypothetical protein